jgi:hypothetical protein
MALNGARRLHGKVGGVHQDEHGAPVPSPAGIYASPHSDSGRRRGASSIKLTGLDSLSP